jgi:ADP-heptose:LPS heptosyltransferase
MCCLFVGNDSGITHLAAAVDTPTMALFGPSDQATWKPFGPQVRVINAQPQCAPCHPRLISNDSCSKNCMQAITVETVYNDCLCLL